MKNITFVLKHTKTLKLFSRNRITKKKLRMYIIIKGTFVNDCADMELNTMFDGQGPLISDKVLIVFQWIIFSIVCQSIVIFGIITNIINIICFVKQGFKDSVNVSLLGMSDVFWFVFFFCCKVHICGICW